MQFSCTYCSGIIVFSNQNQLFCSSCQVAFPVIDDIVFFNEAQVNYSEKTEQQSLIERISYSRNEYEGFLKEKSRKNLPDIYAAFQPFNESSRAFEPFINFFRKHLKSGDIILDTWCRTGWSALYLSALFPEQRIISVWEGNKGVLGYKGFSYWFDKTKRPDNLEIIFSDINHKLPLPDKSIKLIYALDTLHRYSKPNIINEFLRITGDDGFIIFPHVHLANNNPEPFFERGGDIKHGREWDFYLGKKLNGSSKKHFIFSEPELFENPETTKFVSTPETKDYNGLICIFPKDRIPEKLEKWNYDEANFEEQFIYLNPLIEINFHASSVRLNLKKWDSSVEYLLFRHPVYHKKLKDSDCIILDEIMLKICFLSQHRYSVSQICKKLNIDLSTIQNKISLGIELELFRLYPQKSKSNFLQFYHADQQWRPEPEKCTFTELWKNAIRLFPEKILLRSEKDESEFTYSEINSAVLKIATKLKMSGFKKGGTAVLFSNINEEFLICSWAIWLVGGVVVPVNPELSIEDKYEIIGRTKPTLIFIDPEFTVVSSLPEFKEKIISFSSDEELPQQTQTLMNWLDVQETDSNTEFEQINYNDPACILFTSGTTSKSKAVLLSHEAVFNSSLELSKLFNWKSEDIILNLGDSFTMSGLRNPAWASIQNGSSILVIPAKDKKFPEKLSEIIFRWKVSVFGCVPEMIRLFTESTEVSSPKLMKSVKQIICTGSYLPENVKIKFEEHFLKPVLNYYGLTETCGLCAGHKFDDSLDTNESIGKSADSIIQIVNENGDILPENTVGFLRVFSANLMSGYLDDSVSTNSILINGWLYTGDLAEINSEGFIFLKGRHRDIIKLKDGNLIYPDSIENALMENELISEIAVTSILVQNEKEKIAAFVKLKNVSLSDELIYKFKMQVLSKLGNMFVPEIFIEMNELPKGVNGKILKNVLRENYESAKKR